MNFLEPENALKYGYREVLIKHSTIKHTKVVFGQGMAMPNHPTVRCSLCQEHHVQQLNAQTSRVDFLERSTKPV